jgi:hypothetical protein
MRSAHPGPEEPRRTQRGTGVESKGAAGRSEVLAARKPRSLRWKTLTTRDAERMQVCAVHAWFSLSVCRRRDSAGQGVMAARNPAISFATPPLRSR